MIADRNCGKGDQPGRDSFTQLVDDEFRLRTGSHMVLVVIAIIAVLIALILPAAGRPNG